MIKFRYSLCFAFVLFIAFSCTDQITNSCDTGNEIYFGTMAEVQSHVFNAYCVGCHGNNQPNAGLVLVAGKAHSNLINQPAQGSGLVLVRPGQPDSSYLLKRVSALDGESSMPPSGKLRKSLRGLVAQWIENGAPEN